MSCQLGADPIEEVGCGPDIGVDKKQVRGSGRRGPDRAGMRLAEPPGRQPRWDDDRGAERHCNIAGAVGRVVVDHHQLIASAELRDQRRNEIGKRGCFVTCWNDNGNRSTNIARTDRWNGPRPPEQ
jgi:hypothetical protein